MKYGSIAVAAAALTLLSGMAMAQGNGKPRFYIEGGVNSLPSTPGSLGINTFDTLDTLNTPGSLPDRVYGLGVFVPDLSVNPGTFNSQTAEPGFVDHSHGRP